MRKILSITFIISLLSCEKALMEDNPSNDPETNFQILWETVDRKYSFFDLKNINWDSVRTHYAPMVDPSTTDEELFTILDSMLYDLRDGHVNLISDFDLSRNWTWYLDHPVNFNYDVIEREYLKEDHRIAGGIKYTMIDSIGYMYYGSFSSSISIQNLQSVTEYFKDAKGVIIDVRDNGGGSVSNAYLLAQAFINESKTALINFEKTGPAHNDFGNAAALSFQPLANAHYDGPVVVLTNRKSYSATNTFAAIMSQFSNVTIIGDRTGGGGGLPVDNELPNGWRYRFSATISLTPDGYNIESGIPPGIAVDNDPVVNAQGFDQILEAALANLE